MTEKISETTKRLRAAGRRFHRAKAQYESERKALADVVIEAERTGMSYRAIADEVGLHWNRVGQIIRKANG